MVLAELPPTLEDNWKKRARSFNDFDEVGLEVAEIGRKVGECEEGDGFLTNLKKKPRESNGPSQGGKAEADVQPHPYK